MSLYEGCPKCQSKQATPVRFSWWGGIIGPKVLSHVKCDQCKTKYNGKTGRSNAVAIAVYMTVVTVIVLVIGALYRTL